MLNLMSIPVNGQVMSHNLREMPVIVRVLVLIALPVMNLEEMMHL